MAAIPQVGRVRLSSVEALELDEGLLALADLPAFAPHFHLPLQSGDAGILRRMGRRYTPEDFIEKVEAVRSRFPEVGLTTDVIVGFPGESDAAFENTLECCREAGFTRIHAFPFSPREGTPAAGLADPISKARVTERMDALIAEGTRLADLFRRSRIGTEDRVLVEKESAEGDGLVEGWDGPYQRVRFPGRSEEIGQLVRVRITGVEGERCLATRTASVNPLES
ncbi:MAG: radical SAM protein [Planctomycetota bacterium]